MNIYDKDRRFSQNEKDELDTPFSHTDINFYLELREEHVKLSNYLTVAAILCYGVLMIGLVCYLFTK